MSVAQDKAFARRLARKLAQEARVFVRPKIPSKTLRAALKVVEAAGTTGAVGGEFTVSLPHYWALYVHDGRLPFTMPAGQVMCWFREPSDDPRLGGGYPVRVADQRHLTYNEFKHFMHLNRMMERLVYGRLRLPGEPQVGPMIVTNRIRKPTQARRFFDNSVGMAGFGTKAGEIGRSEFSAFVAERLAEELDLKIETKTTFG